MAGCGGSDLWPYFPRDLLQQVTWWTSGGFTKEHVPRMVELYDLPSGKLT